MPRLQIIIVNYRTPDLTVRCLRTLASEVEAEGDCEVIIVDNASGDDSVADVRAALLIEGWDRWAEVIALDHNGGFAAGNNAALRWVAANNGLADFVFFLNPDTEVRPGALRALVSFLEEHPEVGVVGSRLEGTDGVPLHSAFRFHSLLSEWDRGLRLGIVSRLLRRWLVAPPIRDEAHHTDWVCGAAMAVRREVLETVGLLDESFFMY
jgi:GT2 family glycosyltransferase